jgi:uncharacterized protein
MFVAAVGLMISVFGADARAQPVTGAGEARDLALAALRLEFQRDELSSPPADLEAKFRDACERGYTLACRRATWARTVGPDLPKVVEAFEPSCEAGDPAACLVTAWALDGVAPTLSSDERDRTWRKAERYLKDDCDDGFQPACHDLASMVYANKGMVSEPSAPLLRWNMACGKGQAASCLALARLNWDGGPGVTQNRVNAKKFADKACALDYPAACAFVGHTQDKTWAGSMLDTYYGELCQRGHADSCWRLARHYFEGLHPEPEPGRLQALFVRGCDLGHGRSCYESGKYEQDHGGDGAVAAQRFGRGCELGDPASCNAQVQLILTKQVPGNVREAQRAFAIACDEGRSKEACKVLATALIDGVDLPKDAARGRQLLSRACVDETSDPEACFLLGKVYEDGLGGERDRTVASKYFRWSCAAGKVDACMRRGDLLVSDVGVRRDDQEALAMYRSACEGGIVVACTRGGQILFEGTFVKQDFAGAAALFAKGCAGRDAHGCFGLGQSHERGATGAPDAAKAREAYESAVANGSLEAKRALARLLWIGDGGKKDKGRAKSLCREACQGGDPIACRGPEFLKS